MASTRDKTFEIGQRVKIKNRGYFRPIFHGKTGTIIEHEPLLTQQYQVELDESIPTKEGKILGLKVTVDELELLEDQRIQDID